ncbi:MAG: T9SS type A sorting domain-containing protein [Bacteroidota bacterium]
MKTMRFLLPLLLLLPASLWAQDVTVFYEKVSGVGGTEQVKLYLQNNRATDIELGAVNLSVTYQTPSLAFSSVSFSLMENEWGAGGHISIVGANSVQLPKTYFGVEYQQRVLYGASRPSAGLSGIELAAGAPRVHALTVDFTVTTSGSPNYSENDDFSTGFFGNGLDDVNAVEVSFNTQDLATLPVEWLSFEAEQVGTQTVGLEWVTAVEENNAYFGIERSIDGMTFEQIGEVQGAGNTNDPRRYDYLDNDVSVDRLFYRLRQVDLNGSFSYSETRQVVMDQTFGFEFTLYPNPASENLFLTPSDNVSGMFEIKMLDATGRVIQRLRQESITQQGVSFSLGGLADGVYSIEVLNLETYESKTKLFVKK